MSQYGGFCIVEAYPVAGKLVFDLIVYEDLSIIVVGSFDRVADALAYVRLEFPDKPMGCGSLKS